ncbi:MAG: 50S ribosomal protein L6 [Acidobacteriota bacterium]
MSRIGRMPIPVPQGTKVNLAEGVFTAEGPKGKVSQSVFDGFSVAIEDGEVSVGRPSDSGTDRSMHGLLRSLVSNAVEGVSTGFKKELDIVGVGYRAEVKGREVHLALGYSHPVIYSIPEGIDIEIDKNFHMTVTGADRQQVGQVAAELRSLRKPDPYKGKGIKYSDEVIRRKVGKAGA